MKLSRLLLITAWTMQLVAWFVRVHRDGITLRSGPPGWEAWWLSTHIVLHPQAEHATVLTFACCAISSLSTVLFLFVTPYLILRRKLLRTSAWLAAISCVVNAHWLFLFASTWSELRLGYYLWWLSFGVLSAAFFSLAHEHTEPEPKGRSATAASISI